MSFILNNLIKRTKYFSFGHINYCHSVFGIHKLIKQDKPEHFKISPIVKDRQDEVIEIAKQYYLQEHVFVKSRGMCLFDNRAIDEYIYSLLKQGTSVFARTDDDAIAGICVNFSSSPVHLNNIRNFAHYRQDANIKDLLYFIAKLEETPNLWTTYDVTQIFDVRMLTVLPQFRRQGLATLLAEKSRDLAIDSGHKIMRINCINSNDYKIAERCSMQCIAKYPIHKLRSTRTAYIKSDSEYNKILRVYISYLRSNLEKVKFEYCMGSCKINIDDYLQ